MLASEEVTFLWVVWAGFFAATAGEILLFVHAGAAPGPRADAPVLGGVTTVVTASLLVAAAVGVDRHRLGGGGIPTVLMTWLPLKGVAVSGMVAYAVGAARGSHWAYLLAFGAGMLRYHPGRLESVSS